MHQLMPAVDSPGPLDDDRLAALYADGTEAADEGGGAAGRWLRVNMVSTLDGAAMGPDGLSGTISSPSDKAVFNVLRAWSDVVLIGAGTARAERYTRLSHDSVGTDLRRPDGPLLAMVSRSGYIDTDRLFSAEGGDPLLLTCRSADPDAVDEFRNRAGEDSVLCCGQDSVDLPAAIDHLAERGLTRILCEGGPHLLGGLLAGGLVDELDLTIGFGLTGGDAGRIVEGVDVDKQLATHTLLQADDALIGRWFVGRD